MTTPEALSPSTPRAAPPPAETGADGPLAASGPGAPDRAAAPAEAGGAGPPEALPPGWVPPGASVTVAGRQIGGMVYIGTPPKRGARGAPEASRALIDPALPVAAQGADTAGAALPYWPGYAQIPPRCRAAYLDWLATGRSDATYDPGYLFLYFYGLERRFFCDDPPQAERQALLQEVRRLARLHPENRSVQGYLGAFIDVAEILLTDPAESAPRFGPPGWSLPLSLTLGLGLRVREGHPLSADWLLSWLMSDPEHRLRTPATRCFPEFRALFGLLFAERHPEGLLVRPPRAVLSVTYRAASGEFSRDLTPEPQGRPVPDVSGLRRPLSVAVEIADAACAALDRYSRQIGRDPEGRASMAAQTLLPMPLWPLFPMPQMDALRDWAAEIVGQGGLVLASEVVARLEGARPERISKRRLIAASDALARLGYGLAPDPRFALRAPTSREAVVLFDLGGPVERLEETVSEAYRAALMQIALASFVAHADGALVEAERAALTEQVLSAEGLSAAERRRLRANVTWFLAVPPDLALLRRRLKESGAEDHPQFRAAIIAAAHADGVIHPGEVAGIEKLYSALGMDPSRAYADLHAGAEAGPLRMRAAQDATPGEPIPEETAPAPGPAALDAARLAAIRAETERVSSVLGRIFAEAEAEAEEPAAPTAAQAPPGADTALPGLDARHSALLRALLQRPHWPEPEFAALCAQYGLMAEGALETINEWAFEAHDAALLEEDGGYEVSPEVSAAITATIGEESPHDQRDQTETA